jgi:uncharacterized membrane protein
MKRFLAHTGRILGAAFFITSPLLTHLILTYGNPDSRGFHIAAGLLLLCQGILVSILIGRRLPPSLRPPAVIAVMGCTAALCLFHLHSGLMLSSGSPHALIYSTLLIIFGLSLLPGREPIVTYFARTIHGPIAPEIEGYTRRITWAWCWFFGLELLGSAILLLLAPIAWWSAFVNIFNLPLLAAMFLGERFTRAFWVADPPHEYLDDFLRIPKLLKQSLKTTGAEAL